MATDSYDKHETVQKALKAVSKRTVGREEIDQTPEDLWDTLQALRENKPEEWWTDARLAALKRLLTPGTIPNTYDAKMEEFDKVTHDLCVLEIFYETIKDGDIAYYSVTPELEAEMQKPSDGFHHW